MYRSLRERNPLFYHSEQMRRRMRRLLEAVAPILVEGGATFWLDRGTLLGAWRENALIVGDYDVDVRIMQADWVAIYRLLRERLPDDLRVTAMHHGAVIRDPDAGHPTAWFENEDGEFPVAAVEGLVDGARYHSATALVVHFSDSPWNAKPNFDLYSCRVNRHHDCTPADLPRPWEEDGVEYLCTPSRTLRRQSMLIPRDYVFPLARARIGDLELPVPGRTEIYLRHQLGYLGRDAVFNEDTGYWERESDVATTTSTR